jgi:biopolymer transport protein ExbB/TolQ
VGEIIGAIGDFIGANWWLWFVFGGSIVGGVRGLQSWSERAAKRRHKRRLEIIRAKAEAKALAAAALPAGVEESDKRTRADRLKRLMDAHDDVTRRWLEYELDVAKLIAFPTMSDGREALTAAFLRAKKVADELRPASPDARIDAEELAEYRDAVHDYEVAFDVAEQDARRVRDSGFTEAERKRLERARQLLQVAVDRSATAAERQVAYRRVRDELDGLIAVSDEAIEVLEQKVAAPLEQRRPPEPT